MNEETVATISKNQIEEVRVTLGEYQGHKLVSVRVYANWDSAGSPRRPTKKGIALKLERLPALISGLQEAERRARATGALKDEQEAA